jgi:hypothetical protein
MRFSQFGIALTWNEDGGSAVWSPARAASAFADRESQEDIAVLPLKLADARFNESWQLVGRKDLRLPQ